MNRKNLKELLLKVVDKDQLDQLPQEQKDALESFLGIAEETVSGPAEEVPLFSLMIDQFLDMFSMSKESFEMLDSSVESCLKDCLKEATSKSDALDSDFSRIICPVDRQKLVTVMRRHLLSDDNMDAAEQAKLIWIAGLTELKSDLLAMEKSDFETRSILRESVIASALLALVMMDCEELADILPKYVNHSDEDVRIAALFYYAKNLELFEKHLFPQGPERQKLEKILTDLDENGAEDLAPLFLSVFDTPPLPMQVILELMNSIRESVAYARMADVILGWKDLDLLKNALELDSDWRSALGNRLVCTDNAWAGPAVMACLEGFSEDESYEYPLSLLIAGYQFAEDKQRYYESFLDIDFSDRVELMIALSFWHDVSAFKETLKDDWRSEHLKYFDVVDDVKRSASKESLEIFGSLVVGLWCGDDRTLLPSTVMRMVASLNLDVPLAVSAAYHNWECLDWRESEAFFRDHPLMIVMPPCPLYAGYERELSFRTLLLMTRINDPRYRAIIENMMVNCSDLDEAKIYGMHLVCLGGPETPLGNLVGKFLHMDDGDVPVIEESEMTMAVWLLGKVDPDYRELILKGLIPYADQIEFLLPNQVLEGEGYRSSGSHPALRAVEAIDLPQTPMVEGLHDLQEGKMSAWACLAANAESSVLKRVAVKAVAGQAADSPEAMAICGHFLMGDDDDIAAEGVLALNRFNDRLPWYDAMVERLIRDDSTDLLKKILNGIAESGDARYLPLLLKKLNAEELYSWDRDKYAPTLKTIIANQSDGDIIFFDCSEPEWAKNHFSLSTEIDIMADDFEESFKLCLEGLESAKSEALAKENLGRRILIQPITGDDTAQATCTLKAEEFEKIAIFLEVTFTDEESGSIVAEVTDTPRGEVLNALLQSGGPFAVFRASWS